MPIFSTVDHALREINSQAVGPVSFEDVQNHLQEQQQWQSLPYREFIDGRTAEPTFTPADVRRIVEQLRSLSREASIGPTAVLVSTDYAFGILRMLEMLVEDFCEVRPFREEGEARVWIATK